MLLRYNSPMTTLYLEKRDPSQNCRRYYYLMVVSGSLTDACPIVLRRYGRIGGQCRTLAPLPFDTLDAALAYMRRVEERKLRRGYSRP